ncbi:hypothetical protein SAMN04488134_101574 [Amphibacillus marinus]|uniref:Lipoprotein n=1 Tax=Amphibacillus marinus TaxID=872970 RepID=A0A1H8IC59_9BACI|nr:hypothetical protein [Amphibacillus marinus]SEN65757.1 hypothetical protein SAMN04488134_101574 [Amphibacillus marinus]
MIKQSVILIGISLLVLIACSNKQPVIVQEELNEHAEESTELIEEEIDSGEEESDIQQFVEFTLIDRQISLHIDQIPIISNYLAQHRDRNQAINEMQLTQINEEGFESLFLLNFACQDNACSNLLLNTDTEQSKLLADQSDILAIQPSPDRSKLLITYQRPQSLQEWDLNRLMVFDLDSWSEVKLTSDNLTLTGFQTFQWPIFSAEWQDDENIQIEIPNVNQPDSESLTEWFESEEQELQFHILYLTTN